MTSTDSSKVVGSFDVSNGSPWIKGRTIVNTSDTYDCNFFYFFLKNFVFKHKSIITCIFSPDSMYMYSLKSQIYTILSFNFFIYGLFRKTMCVGII